MSTHFDNGQIKQLAIFITPNESDPNSNPNVPRLFSPVSRSPSFSDFNVPVLSPPSHSSQTSFPDLIRHTSEEKPHSKARIDTITSKTSQKKRPPIILNSSRTTTFTLSPQKKSFSQLEISPPSLQTETTLIPRSRVDQASSTLPMQNQIQHLLREIEDEEIRNRQLKTRQEQEVVDLNALLDDRRRLHDELNSSITQLRLDIKRQNGNLSLPLDPKHNVIDDEIQQLENTLELTNKRKQQLTLALQQTMKIVHQQKLQNG